LLLLAAYPGLAIPFQPLMFISKFLRPASSSLKVLVIAQCLLATLGYAQYGASPSQTGMFFDDFRTRQVNESKASAGTRDGDVM